MKEYIKNNWTPLAIGFASATMYIATLNFLESIVIKIALIYAK